MLLEKYTMALEWPTAEKIWYYKTTHLCTTQVFWPNKTIQSEIETDHKLLETILKKPLHQVPPKLQKMVMVIQKYTISVRYHPDKEIVIADVLFQAFITQETNDPILGEFEINICRHCWSKQKLKQLRNKLKGFGFTRSEAHSKNGRPTNKRAAPVTIVTY